MITVSQLTDRDAAAWDAYVMAHPDGLPHHRAGWRTVLRRAHNYETPFLLAREDGRLVGVLPLFFIRSRLVGHRAMTMPGGLCADSPAIAQALVDAAIARARDAAATSLVIQDTRRAWPGSFTTSSGHVHWRVDLRGDAATLWAALDGNIRRQVRIARRHNLRVEIARDGRLLDPFYKVLTRFSHQKGTPAFGRRFLTAVVDAFPDDHATAVVFAGDGAGGAAWPVAGYFQLTLGRTLHGLWGAALHTYRPQRASYLAIWEIMADALAHDITWLDMGRSPANSTTSDFKGQWGGVPSPVYQQIAPLRGQPAQSIVAQVQHDGRFRLVQRLWPRLPWPLAQYLGPRLRRHVPFA